LRETLRYLDHSDDPHDPGHRAYLECRLAPLLTRLRPGARGLDYGSGRTSTLAMLLAERGIIVERFDPCFMPDERPLARTYEFVTCTEVVEHFHEPRRDLAIIARLLRPGSLLAFTTALAHDGTDFSTWWYARDETHVSFYRRETLAWIAERFGWELTEVSAGGVLFVSR
jgi:SAM-dependent methyltransferase